MNSLDPAYGRGRGGHVRLSKGQSTERFLCQEGGANAKPLWGNREREREGGGGEQGDERMKVSDYCSVA